MNSFVTAFDPFAFSQSAFGVPSTPSFVGVLDAYAADLSSSWSICRRQFTSYTGSLIRVRRSGDSSEFDFGYDVNGNLDTAAVVAFVVAGGGTQHGHIVRIYDQLGGAAGNLIQGTAARQPRVVISGVIQTAADGRACAVQTNDANSVYASYTRSAADFTLGGVVTTRSSVSGAGQAVASQSSYMNGGYVQSPADFTKKGLFVDGFTNGGVYTNNSRECLSYRNNSTLFSLSCNGAAVLTVTNGGASRAISNPIFGAAADDGFGSCAKIQEFYFATSGLNDTKTFGIENALIA